MSGKVAAGLKPQVPCRERVGWARLSTLPARQPSPSGRLHAPGDCYAQSIYVFERIREALEQVGAQMHHVVRTRAYLTDLSQAGGFVRAHGEVFADIDPVTTGVEAGLTRAGMMVEIEVDAIVHSESGTIEF